MARQSTDSILNSLKGRIWLAASALAILNCIFGLGTYLAVSFFVTDPFFSIFVTFFAAAFMTMIFGWWLSNEVIRPIESVGLAAKSLERSPSASLPKTTGSTETDELLRTLHRNSQQLQNLISMMDDVASGKISSALVPIQNADRLSTSFQKLVGKVTDSISAKEELDDLNAAVARIISDISGIRGGNLNVTVRNDLAQTKEIADGFRYLTNRLGELIRQVKLSSADAGRAMEDARKSLRAAIEVNDERSGKIAGSLNSAGDGPNRLQNIVSEMSAALSSFEASFGSIRKGENESADETARVSRLRAQIGEAAKKVQRIRDRSQSIPQIGRSAEELARRSNLIALNTSIQANNPNFNTHSATLLSDEIGLLSEKSGSLSKEIFSTNETLAGEIAELESVIAALSSDITEITKAFVQHAALGGEIEKYLGMLIALQAKFSACTAEQSAESEKITSLLVSLANNGDTLSETEGNIQKVSNFVESLRDSIADFHPVVTSEPPLATPRFSSPESVELQVPLDKQLVADPIDLLGEN